MRNHVTSIIHASVIAATAFASISVAAGLRANAQEPTLAPAVAAPTVRFAEAARAVPSDAFIATLAIVCEPGRFVLSDRAELACLRGEFPRLAASGDRFGNSALGAELNTLARQVTR